MELRERKELWRDAQVPKLLRLRETKAKARTIQEIKEGKRRFLEAEDACNALQMM